MEASRSSAVGSANETPGFVGFVPRAFSPASRAIFSSGCSSLPPSSSCGGRPRPVHHASSGGRSGILHVFKEVEDWVGGGAGAERWISEARDDLGGRGGVRGAREERRPLVVLASHDRSISRDSERSFAPKLTVATFGEVQLRPRRNSSSSPPSPGRGFVSLAKARRASYPRSVFVSAPKDRAEARSRGSREVAISEVRRTTPTRSLLVRSSSAASSARLLGIVAGRAARRRPTSPEGTLPDPMFPYHSAAMPADEAGAAGKRPAEDGEEGGESSGGLRYVSCQLLADHLRWCLGAAAGCELSMRL